MSKQNFTQKLTASEFAALKGCTRATIYNNKDKLTWVTVPGAKVQKILMDDKAIVFKPDIRKVNIRFTKTDIEQSLNRFKDRQK